VLEDYRKLSGVSIQIENPPNAIGETAAAITTIIGILSAVGKGESTSFPTAVEGGVAQLGLNGAYTNGNRPNWLPFFRKYFHRLHYSTGTPQGAAYTIFNTGSCLFELNCADRHNIPARNRGDGLDFGEGLNLKLF
jgi:hypothetical protein